MYVASMIAGGHEKASAKCAARRHGERRVDEIPASAYCVAGAGAGGWRFEALRLA